MAIAGGGFAGLALASVCADAGLGVTLLERRPHPAPEGVGLVLQPNGLSALERLGVLEPILEIGHRIEAVRQCDASGRVRARGSYAELDHAHPYLVVVERTQAISVLARRLPSSVSVRFGCTVSGLVRDERRVRGLRYADASGAERTLGADCVIGADGVNSPTRRAMGARLRWRSGPDRYLIGLAPCEPPDAAATLYCGRGWCNGVLPFGDRTYFFDRIDEENRHAVESGDFEAWRAIYEARTPGGKRIAADLSSFDDVGFLSGRTHLAAPRTRSGVALVGDAAAAVHPHNGQGANLALEDALELGRAFAEHGPAGAAALESYARARKPKVRRAVPWSIFIGRTLDGPSVGWRANRRIGYVTSRVPAVRRATTRMQAGLG